jgi:hypothetical protein
LPQDKATQALNTASPKCVAIVGFALKDAWARLAFGGVVFGLWNPGDVMERVAQ